MGKGTSRLEAIAQQNELLKEQNELLRQQNELMKRSASSHTNTEREIFIEDIDHDEMRSGFLVTSQRKKMWNVQIGLLNEFARICKKHNLRWFANAGTLLGTIRHKGFIPWDDDVDVMMLRPDYEKFKLIAAQEVKSPYILRPWYDYRLESDETSLPSEENLTMISRELEMKYFTWHPFWPIIRFADSRTTMVSFDERNIFNGIFIEIFPFDPVPPFSENQQKINFEIAKALLLATIHPLWVKKIIAEGKNFPISKENLQNFFKLTYRQRGLQFENFMLKNFFRSEFIAEVADYCTLNRLRAYATKNFDDVVYMPFEKIELPVPVGYENFLASVYGQNWRKPVIYPPYACDYSADIPYEEYFKKYVKVVRPEPAR